LLPTYVVDVDLGPPAGADLDTPDGTDPVLRCSSQLSSNQHQGNHQGQPVHHQPQTWRTACENLAAACETAGVEVVVSQRTIHPCLAECLLARGILPVARVSLRFIDAVRRASGGATVSSVAWPPPGDDTVPFIRARLGMLGGIEPLPMAGRTLTALRCGGGGTAVVTVVVAARSTGEAERASAAVDHAVRLLRTFIREPCLVPGGGCWAAWIGAELRRRGMSHFGIDTDAARGSVADAFDAIATAPAAAAKAQNSAAMDVLDEWARLGFVEADDHDRSRVYYGARVDDVGAAFDTSAGSSNSRARGPKLPPRVHKLPPRVHTRAVLRLDPDGEFTDPDGDAIVEVASTAHAAIDNAAALALTLIRGGIALPSAYRNNPGDGGPADF
jgi:hypothetical protein